MAEFDDWADIYDIVHSGLPGESDFYIQQAQKTEGQVLELGCGTGRITIPIALAGIPITGLDLSSSMLKKCEYKWSQARIDSEIEAHTLRHIQGDMSTFQIDQKFTLIIMPYRTFMHLARPRDQRNCLSRVAVHLEPGGRFIMNIWVPSATYIYAFSAKPEQTEYTHIDTYNDDSENKTIEHYHSVQCQELEQRMSEEHLFISKNTSDKEISRKTLPMIRTWIGVREMHNLIEASPLEVDHMYGDFDGSPLNRNSTESIWILKLRSH